MLPRSPDEDYRAASNTQHDHEEHADLGITKGRDHP